ncbi:MAG: hypothetical protein OSJ67_06565 [Clostridia bacterium]|nr:hypothetical protein [Clostridia bacterium]
MSKTQKKTVAIIAVLALIAIVVIVIALSCFTVGRHDRKSILVESYYGDCEIEIPVKMRNGVYTPTHNAFGSDLSIAQLAEKVKIHTYKGTSYEVELYGDRALIKAIKDNEVKGFAVLIDRGKYYDKNIRYFLTNCHKMMNIGEGKTKGALIPWHLINRSIALESEVSNEIELDSGVKIQDIADFYGIGGYYTVSTKDATITIETNGNEDRSSFTVEYDEEKGVARYTFN